MTLCTTPLRTHPHRRQKWKLKYCDNDDECNTRRVISAKTSSDGAAWSKDAPLIVPDADDPPELQFYRMRPVSPPLDYQTS